MLEPTKCPGAFLNLLQAQTRPVLPISMHPSVFQQPDLRSLISNTEFQPKPTPNDVGLTEQNLSEKKLPFGLEKKDEGVQAEVTDSERREPAEGARPMRKAASRIQKLFRDPDDEEAFSNKRGPRNPQHVAQKRKTPE